MLKKYRVRYAPSPTGFLHIGNTRTALFNYLLAKHYQGDFVLRIEDTDVERNVPGAIESQLDNLRWLGIFPDETVDKPGNYGPYSQLKRLEIYQTYARELLLAKKAYYCFCTSFELEESREHQLEQGRHAPQYDRKCLRLDEMVVKERIKDNVSYNIRFYASDDAQYDFIDLVRGPVHFDGKDLGDWVIIKSNGIPTYNFAVVIDDILMEISHVIRGEEHISNTPRQLMIYQALNYAPPIFAHLTIIVNEQHKKLSKRDGHLMQFISQYRDLGYLPAAIFNFISLLGWSPKGKDEIFTAEELIKMFDENRFSKSPSMFDVQKLTWTNSVYLKTMPDQEYIEFVRPFLVAKYDISNRENQWVEMLLLIYKKELQYGAEINDLVKMFFVPTEKISIDTKMMLTGLDNYQELVNSFLKEISESELWSETVIKEIISNLGHQYDIKGKELYMPIRIFASHQEHGPELAKVIYLLGREQVIKNVNNLLI